MPRQSERQVLLDTLESVWGAELCLGFLQGDSSSDSEGNLEDFDEFSSLGDNELSSSDDSDDEMLSMPILHTCISSQRYIGERELAPRNLLELNVIRSWPEQKFQQTFRMTPIAFQKILGMISNHSVFYNDRHTYQIQPEFQLAVALYRFGLSGTGASRANIANFFKISEGAVTKYTDRVMVALLSLEPSVVKWPSPPEKQILKSDIQDLTGFPSMIGIVDSTYIALSYKPSKNGEDYYCRNEVYAVVALIVCDHKGKITYIHVGFPGSSTDSHVFLNSRLWLSREDLFHGEEYLLADSAFPLSAICIPPFKETSSQPDDVEFDGHLASVRVKSDHCIGMLKGRFPSLRGLQVQLLSNHDHMQVNLWVRACAVLHNLLLEDYYDPNWTDVNDLTEEEPYQATGNIGAPPSTPNEEAFAKEKRQKIKEMVLAHYADDS